jgi:hypothetical protein
LAAVLPGRQLPIAADDDRIDHPFPRRLAAEQADDGAQGALELHLVLLLGLDVGRKRRGDHNHQGKRAGEYALHSALLPRCRSDEPAAFDLRPEHHCTLHQTPERQMSLRSARRRYGA